MVEQKDLQKWEVPGDKKVAETDGPVTPPALAPAGRDAADIGPEDPFDETVHATPVDVELGSGFSEGPLAMGRPCCAHHVAEGDGGVLDHLSLRVESRRSGSHVRPPHICLGQ